MRTPALPALSMQNQVMRVLLVDGDEEAAVQSESGLRAASTADMRIDRVATLADAILALLASAYDVVVMDLALPDASASAAVASIRTASENLPIVAYANELDDELALRALRAGAQECIATPDFTPARLSRVLSFAIERQQQRSSLEAAEREAAHRASHDQLTGLANRQLFVEQLERALAYGARYSRKTGVLFVDLDGFKDVNDTLGHDCGDRLLREVANRLSQCVRRSDAVARLGGDEFAILLPDVTSRLDVSHVREAILAKLAEPIDLGTQLLEAEASIGTAMAPLDGESPQTLLAAADLDMYKEKSRRRRTRTTPFANSTPVGVTPNTGVDLSSRTVMKHRESRMREALERGEFEIHAQPIVDLRSGRITAAEAFVRWRDPFRGLLWPASFLTLAEDTGLIVPLGEQILRDACRAVLRWRSMTNDNQMRVHVNLSAVQLRERSFAQRVADILGETACPVDAVVFELTEKSSLIDGETAMASLRDLKALGTGLVVDDFGVGHASLTFVRDTPVDAIKLDRRFVGNMLVDARDLAIVASIVRLAQGLSLDVIAEGVESADHSRGLQRLQCHVQQGRHVSGELPLADFEASLDRLSQRIDRLSSTNSGRRNSERSTGLPRQWSVPSTSHI